MKRPILKSALVAAPVALAAVGCCGDCAPKKPNVIVILADDLGLGDMSAYGGTAIKTPNLDRLANEGVQFNNGYATSATSTPSRYAMMTGIYPWKNPNAQILQGDAPLIISTEQYTLPKMMQERGYKTAAIGKWHLGMGAGNVNWNEKIYPAANDIGFDYSCLIAATNDRVPTVYVEDGEVLGLDPADPLYVSYKENFKGEPTAISNPELVKMPWSHGHNQSVMNGIPRIGYQTGGKSAYWVDEDMADYFVDKVNTFITESKNEPFFLYFGLHQPHVPRAPHSRFVGTTELGARGDAIVEADWCVGELLAHLEAEGILENTLIIFSSDNGPVLDDGYKDGAPEMNGDHDARGGTRGGKYSLFDGGTHVPFMAYWKGQITPVRSDALICQMDIMPSIAKLIGAKIPEMDGQEHLAALLGKSEEGRESLVHEAQGKLAFRKGDWALIPPYKGSKRNQTNNESGNFQRITLWDLANDPSQQSDVTSQHPEVVKELWAEFLELTDGYYKSSVAEVALQ